MDRHRVDHGDRVARHLYKDIHSRPLLAHTHHYNDSASVALHLHHQKAAKYSASLARTMRALALFAVLATATAMAMVN